MTPRSTHLPGRCARHAVWLGAALACACACAADDPPLVVEPDILAPADKTANAPDNADAAALRELTTETVAAMQQAQAGFAEGVLNEESEALQAGILERLRRLSDLARQQSQVRTAGQSSPAANRGAQSSNSGDGQGAAGRNLDAAESNEAATGEATGSAPGSTAARDLATSVWGHLPARQRDRMQSRFSERFLPQYEQLVRQYYEALATDEPPAK